MKTLKTVLSVFWLVVAFPVTVWAYTNVYGERLYTLNNIICLCTTLLVFVGVSFINYVSICWLALGRLE